MLAVIIFNSILTWAVSCRVAAAVTDDSILIARSCKKKFIEVISQRGYITYILLYCKEDITLNNFGLPAPSSPGGVDADHINITYYE